MSLLKVQNLKKIYQTKNSGVSVEALKDVNFQIEPGEFVSIMGESGSGKSTLMNIIAALDRPTSGLVELNGVDLSQVSDQKLADFRREHLGFIFQDYNLLDSLSIKDNIILPLVLSKVDINQMGPTIDALADKLNIKDLLEKYPYEISGGQKQRVASARALISRPDLILGDEPTGALDSKNSDELLKMFVEINQTGQTILMVTHSAFAASFSNRVLFIRDGKIANEVHRNGLTSEQFANEINRIIIEVLS